MGLKLHCRRLSILLQNWRQSRHHSPSTSLLSLPNDLLLLIIANLDLHEIKPLLLVNHRLSFLLTPVYQSLAIDQLGILQWDQFPGLHWAAARGHKKLVKLLLERGVNINMPAQPHGTTALHYSALNGHDAIVRLLLQRGAAVDSRDHVFKEAASEGARIGTGLVNLHGMTPLHYAAVNGREGAVRLLLDAGAGIEARDQVNGRTALILAAAGGWWKTARVLLERGADLVVVDRSGWRALDYAIADDARSWNRAAPLLENAERRRQRRLRWVEVEKKSLRRGGGILWGGGILGGGLDRVKGYCSDDYQQTVGEFLSLGEGPVAMGTRQQVGTGGEVM